MLCSWREINFAWRNPEQFQNYSFFGGPFHYILYSRYQQEPCASVVGAESVCITVHQTQISAQKERKREREKGEEKEKILLSRCWTLVACRAPRRLPLTSPCSLSLANFHSRPLEVVGCLWGATAAAVHPNLEEGPKTWVVTSHSLEHRRPSLNLAFSY